MTKPKLAFAHMFPPFVDAYWTGESVTKRSFNTELLDRCTEYYTEFIAGYLRHYGYIAQEDVLDYPIYVGVWNNEYYGVFLAKAPDDEYSVWSVEKSIKKINSVLYNEGDRT